MTAPVAVLREALRRTERGEPALHPGPGRRPDRPMTAPVAVLREALRRTERGEPALHPGPDRRPDRPMTAPVAVLREALRRTERGEPAAPRLLGPDGAARAARPLVAARTDR
ncbi:hypothetical protein [Dactylosporangium sp. CA-139066]|uniref:hypothetical protein n=1 Tax=Dactylosporangium sp. CA-139066 TaxID=3239930 RepID=UPI003D8A6F49